MPWFYEKRTGKGWSPCLTQTKPVVETKEGVMTIKRISGPGEVLRAKPSEITEEHRHLSLEALRDIYGVDEQAELDAQITEGFKAELSECNDDELLEARLETEAEIMQAEQWVEAIKAEQRIRERARKAAEEGSE